jgi:hypothetical protein
MTKDEQRAEAQRRRQERMTRPPTWKGAIQRAGIAAGLFVVLVTLLFKQSLAASASLGVFMLAVYIPLSYITDRAIYNWRQKKGVIPPSKQG